MKPATRVLAKKVGADWTTRMKSMASSWVVHGPWAYKRHVGKRECVCRTHRNISRSQSPKTVSISIKRKLGRRNGGKTENHRAV